MPDTVMFIGDCMAEGYFEVNVHFEFLSEVRQILRRQKAHLCGAPT